jgi:hypothetical protein
MASVDVPTMVRTLLASKRPPDVDELEGRFAFQRGVRVASRSQLGLPA